MQDLICLLIDVSKLVATYIVAHFHSSLLWLAQSTTIKKRSMDTQTGTMTANPRSLGWFNSTDNSENGALSQAIARVAISANIARRRTTGRRPRP